MEQFVVNAILKYDLLKRAVVSSFNPLCIRKIKSLNSNIITAQLWGDKKNFSSFRWIYISHPDLFHGDIDQLNHDIVTCLKKMKLNIYAFTVNSEEQFKKANDLKLNGIFTDNPI